MVGSEGYYQICLIKHHFLYETNVLLLREDFMQNQVNFKIDRSCHTIPDDNVAIISDKKKFLPYRNLS